MATDIQRQFAEAPSVDSLLDAVVDIVRKLTGFHRVMIYEFDQDFNGTVIKEWRGPEARDTYKGLRFPSSDIPPQARTLVRCQSWTCAPRSGSWGASCTS